MNKQTADSLAQNFDTAFAAPDGIKKLRELILTLAMQGKLVPQDPSDPPASQLLKEIEAEKKRLVKEGKIKAPKPMPEITAEEVPYALPVGWAWVRLGDISQYIQRGKGPSYIEAPEIPVISQKCIQWSGFNKSVVRFIDPITLGAYQDERFIRSGDLLWNSTGTGTIGRINIYKDELIEFKKVVADSHVTVIRLIGQCNDFVLNYLMSPSIQNHIEENASGTTNQIELNTSAVINQVTPLPPLPEQHRIVAKIDQLMVRCDALEKLRNEREQKRRSAHTAALKQLLDAPAGDSFTDAWQFINRHFGELYAIHENVTELRKAILQLAVMGKLVSQNPNDPPASQLLKELDAEKKRLLKQGKIRVSKPLPVIKQKEVPRALPRGWEWVRLGELGNSQTGTTPPSKDHENYGDYIPFIGPGDIKRNEISYLGGGLSESGVSKGRLIEKGSVLMVCIGGSIGKHAINDRDITCNQQINTLTPYAPISVNYLFFSMAAEWFQKCVVSQAGGSATPIINKQKWSSILIPIPPTLEQHRITEKVEKLMALCDTLEQRIVAASSKQTQLLGAMMAQV